MESWAYDTCGLCHGVGKFPTGTTCPVCNGFGLWEFKPDDNHYAVKALVSGDPPFTDRARIICNRRLAEVTPDNFSSVIEQLEKKRKKRWPDFDALHKAGAERWGWAWVHTNRFAIELCKLCGGHPTEHKEALSMLAWVWLEAESLI